MIEQALPGLEWTPESLLPEHYPEHCPGSLWNLDAVFWRRAARGAPTFAPDDESEMRSPTGKELCAYWSLVWPTRVYDRAPRGKKTTYGATFEAGRATSWRILAGNWVGWARENELREARLRLQAALPQRRAATVEAAPMPTVPKEILEMMRRQTVGADES